jgi:hypothetical protein
MFKKIIQTRDFDLPKQKWLNGLLGPYSLRWRHKKVFFFKYYEEFKWTQLGNCFKNFAKWLKTSFAFKFLKKN